MIGDRKIHINNMIVNDKKVTENHASGKMAFFFLFSFLVFILNLKWVVYVIISHFNLF